MTCIGGKAGRMIQMQGRIRFSLQRSGQLKNL
jgi:hypothetical protein